MVSINTSYILDQIKSLFFIIFLIIKGSVYEI